MKVLITDPVAQECIDILESEPDIEVDLRPKLPPDEIKAIIGDYSALIVRSGTKVTADIIEAADNLKVIGRAGAGVDNIDVDAATRKGIVVMNTPGGNTISTAEHTFSLILALSRNIPQAMQSLKEGRWDRKKYLGVELYGKVLGIIGLGKVGREVARRAIAFGMRVLAYDPFISEAAAKEIGAELVDLDGIYSSADYISIHTPLNEETRHMISSPQFAKCKRGVRIINCARGGIVDERALLKAIEDGIVGGAALDVFEEEPPSPDNPLLSKDEVIYTPHLGASTKEAQLNVAIQVAEQVRDLLMLGEIRNAVNLPTMDRHVYEGIRWYMELGERIGSIQAQLTGGVPISLSIEYRGEVLDHPTAPITSSILKGIMGKLISETINLVNAPVVARERGVKIDETRSTETGNFTSLITVTYSSTAGKRTISGTIFGERDLRIVNVDGYDSDAIPEGHMVFCMNNDVPGIIGWIGTVLGRNGINIAKMSWGRDRPKGKAITVLNLDSSIPDKVLEELLENKDILWAKRVKL